MQWILGSLGSPLLSIPTAFGSTQGRGPQRRFPITSLSPIPVHQRSRGRFLNNWTRDADVLGHLVDRGEHERFD